MCFEGAHEALKVGAALTHASISATSLPESNLHFVSCPTTAVLVIHHLCDCNCTSHTHVCTMLRASRSALAAAKETTKLSTGITGLVVDPNWRQTLTQLYEKTLKDVQVCYAAALRSGLA